MNWLLIAGCGTMSQVLGADVARRIPKNFSGGNSYTGHGIPGLEWTLFLEAPMAQCLAEEAVSATEFAPHMNVDGYRSEPIVGFWR